MGLNKMINKITGSVIIGITMLFFTASSVYAVPIGNDYDKSEQLRTEFSSKSEYDVHRLKIEESQKNQESRKNQDSQKNQESRENQEIQQSQEEEKTTWYLSTKDVIIRLSEIVQSGGEEAVYERIIELSEPKIIMVKGGKESLWKSLLTDDANADFSNLIFEENQTGYSVEMTAYDSELKMNFTSNFTVYIEDDLPQEPKYAIVHFYGTDISDIKVDIVNNPVLRYKDIDVPKREGHTFTGWYSDEGCKKPFLLPDSSEYSKQEIFQSITLYPKWKTNSTLGNETSQESKENGNSHMSEGNSSSVIPNEKNPHENINNEEESKPLENIQDIEPKNTDEIVPKNTDVIDVEEANAEKMQDKIYSPDNEVKKFNTKDTNAGEKPSEKSRLADSRVIGKQDVKKSNINKGLNENDEKKGNTRSKMAESESKTRGLRTYEKATAAVLGTVATALTIGIVSDIRVLRWYNRKKGSGR